MGQATPIKPRSLPKPVFYLLAGPNGAGKSTLFKAEVLAGTIPADAEFVNAERILERYPRTIANLTLAVRRADAAVLYDTSALTPDTLTAVALCKRNWTQELVAPLPQWASKVLG